MILDRELTDSYRLLAQATDGGGRWCRAEVRLKVTDVNDNPPMFTQSQFSTSIYEDTVPKALLTRVPAIDPDEGNSTSLTRHVYYVLMSDFLPPQQILTQGW